MADLQYRTGSFRGIKFLTVSSDSKDGRRVVTHEYPFRDDPETEDLGRMAQKFDFQALVIGANYRGQRDRLRNALAQGGDGTLVHPYLGAIRVKVGEFSIRESTRNGGMAEFRIAFHQAGVIRYPESTADTRSQVRSAAASATTAAQSGFSTSHSVSGTPAWVSASSTSAIQSFAQRLRSLAGAISSPPASIGGWYADVNDLSLSVAALISSPLRLAQRITSLSNGLGSLFNVPLNAIQSYRSLFGWSADRPAAPARTPSRRRQGVNLAAIEQLVRDGAIITAAAQVPQVEFSSHYEADALRTELDEAFEERLLTANDVAYEELDRLRVAVVRDITSRGANLARVVEHTPSATVPALVIGHRLYGDAARAGELLARNPIQHPGFVPGGQPLEVLNA